MELKLLPPKKILDKAFQKQRPLRSEIEGFKNHLTTLLSKINEIESEENQKNHLRDFLLNTYYLDKYEVNTKENKDLVIHLGKTNADAVGVIVEAKKPSNKAEMISEQNANCKALHELILYYFDEREKHNNTEQKQLIATNIHQWYIFDANTFDQYIYKNSALKKLYQSYVNDKKTTDFFYTEAAKIITKSSSTLECAYFDIRDYEKLLSSDKKEDIKRLIALFKILSPQHLLKLPVANDSNALNEKFYRELLHIIGLEEHKEGSKTIIRRVEKSRQSGSLIEMVISMLETKNSLRKVPNLSEYGENKQEQLFSVALQLCITWVNRLLFLKLLEAQLKDYHNGDNSYTFLNIETLPDFDELFKLFHNVLAKPIAERTPEIQNKYSKVPYLNSSLFDFSDIEDATITVNDLDDNAAIISFYSHTKLKARKKDEKGLQALEYLFAFLNAYDFASEAGEGIQEDESHQLINASVLGKVFEKINGYKDGSIYTPGFITMYMCRQAIRPAVVQKFNEAYGWEVEEFSHLYNYLDKLRKPKDILAANAVINSLHICDPAVGSGHFLVSALNELIAIKHELGILADENGKTFRHYDLEIANDELIITDSDDEFFSYHIANGKPAHKESQRLQESLFKEKQTLIENCLFGVDINPNSVKICRLRLWIELLKNAYYKADAASSHKGAVDSHAELDSVSEGAEESHAEFSSVSAGKKKAVSLSLSKAAYTELETLPNIDINIKSGNSLLSRFDLDADLRAAFNKQKFNLSTYKLLVENYHKSRNKEEKDELLTLINKIKEEYSQAIYSTDPRRKKLSEIRGQLALVQNNFDLFGQKMDKAKQKLEERRLTLLLEQKEKELEEAESGALYRNAFEWRFEFPEVLNEKGDFIGFDVVIGNPPYMIVYDIGLKTIYETFYSEFKRNNDLYVAFIKKGFEILRSNGLFSFITPNTFLKGNYFKELRHYLSREIQVVELNDFGNEEVFEGVNVFCSILNALKIKPVKGWVLKEKLDISGGIIELGSPDFILKNEIIKKLDECGKLEEFFYIKDVGFNYWSKGRAKTRGGSIGSRVFYRGEKEVAEDIPFVKGSDISRFYIGESNNYLKHNWEELLNSNDTFRFSEDFLKTIPKIVYRQTSSNIIAAIDFEGRYLDKTSHLVINKEDYSFNLKYILAILNSSLLNYYLNQYKNEGGRAFAQIKTVDIKNMPFISLDNQHQQPFITLVDKILAAKKENPAADTSKWEAEIDQLVYEIYNLTPEEIAIVEGKAS